MSQYLCLAGTPMLAAYSQLIVRARSGMRTNAEAKNPVVYLVKMMLDPLVLGSLLAAGLAALFWMPAIRSMSVSYAYPFAAPSFVLVPVAAVLILGKTIGLMQAVGIGLIVTGVISNAASE